MGMSNLRDSSGGVGGRGEHAACMGKKARASTRVGLGKEGICRTRFINVDQGRKTAESY